LSEVTISIAWSLGSSPPRLRESSLCMIYLGLEYDIRLVMRDRGFWFLDGWFGTTRRAIGKMGYVLKYMIHSQI
jgi:hypothetical protein